MCAQKIKNRHKKKNRNANLQRKQINDNIKKIQRRSQKSRNPKNPKNFPRQEKHTSSNRDVAAATERITSERDHLPQTESNTISERDSATPIIIAKTTPDQNPATQVTAELDSETPAGSESTKVDREIPEVKQKRRRRGLVFWVSGIVLVAALVIGSFTLISKLSGQSKEETSQDESNNGTNDDENEDQDNDGSDQPDDEKDSESDSSEGSDSDASKEPTPQPEPKPNPDQSISPRPDNPAKDPNVTPGSKLVALTFDDGPSAATTPRLLDILKQKGVKVTFFVLGNMAQRSPDILRREVAEGHEVGSHTPYHNQLTKLNFSQVRAEAIEMDRIFTDILGTVPPFTRPPYGSFNQTVKDALAQPLVLWSVDPLDWKYRNAATVRSNVVSATRDGSIILMHDIHATTVDAVAGIIDDLRAQGYEFLTVSELAAAKDQPLLTGWAYYSF